jgi:hypothetical protein
VEPAPEREPEVAGRDRLVPAVPKHRRRLVVPVAGHRLRVDDQPRLAVAGQHVLVVQVAMEHHPRPAVGEQVGDQREGLLHQSVRDRGVAGQGAQLRRPAVEVRRHREQLPWGRDVDPLVEPRHDLTGLENRH